MHLIRSDLSRAESKLVEAELNSEDGVGSVYWLSRVKSVQMMFVTFWPQGYAANSVIFALLRRHPSLVSLWHC